MSKFLRKLLRKNKGWVSGESYSITVPAGKWHMSQKVTLKQNGKIKTTYPIVTAIDENGLPVLAAATHPKSTNEKRAK